MKKSFQTTTSATFNTRDGRTVRLEEVFEGIDNTISSFIHQDGNRMSGEELEDMKDAAQDAAVKVLENLDRFDLDKCHGKPQVFGYCVARSKALDALERADRRRTIFTPLVRTNQDGEECVPQALLGYHGDEFEPDAQLESKENLAYIKGKMNSLNDRYRRIIELAADGHKPREIAKILGCTPKEASMTLFRARQAMKKALGPEFLSEYGISA